MAALPVKLNVTSAFQRAIGPEIQRLLEDDDVVEVMLNDDGSVWRDTHSQGRAPTDISINAQDAKKIISLVAGLVDDTANDRKPYVEAELPITGHRFSGVLPPIVQSPAFTIRKHASIKRALDDYVKDQILTDATAAFLRQAVSDKKNILLSGGTGSGKTTLANALIAEMERTEDRIVIIEDTQELQCSAADQLRLRTKPGIASMRDLVRRTMRFRPDRIIVGEVRGGEALDLIKAWNTGTPGGIATIHADSAQKALMRLEQLISEVSQSPQREAIASTINVIVQISRTGTGRKVREVFECSGLSSNGAYAGEFIGNET